MEIKNINNIPADKFKFANNTDNLHDKKLDTKPVSFMQDAWRRFRKNKGAVVGAIVITMLVLFAIIAPFCTPYQPSYSEQIFSYAAPKLPIFVNSGIDFWDGCRDKVNANYLTYITDYALGLETGKEVIKRGDVTKNEDGSYTYRYDTYYGIGFGQYKQITPEKYADIQRYQNETGRQVLYPIVKFSDRPKAETLKNDANIYYVVENPNATVVRPKLDKNGNIINNYWKYEEGSLPGLAVDYNSIRIEGEDGITEDGKTYYYVYGRTLTGTIEVRADNYEYNIYEHTQEKKDGIGEPMFYFGATGDGKDIFACLSYGARFSFLFALLVAIANLLVGVIWGSISGYYGGKIDMAMERFVEILGAIPTMIVITLLKYHMGSTSQSVVLFIAFFATGWIGMAGRTRMQFYRFKNQEYVLTARTLGARDRRIMFKHIFPNAIGTLVTSCALIIPSMIYSETSLSYLGIVNLESGNTTSVGTLIAAGQAAVTIDGAGYVIFFPCAFLILLMLSFNLFGNGLRDAFNPSLRGTEE